MPNDERCGNLQSYGIGHFLREGALVKRLHLLETIESRIGDADHRRVYLTPQRRDVAVDPSAAAVHALELPLGHPPLARATVPGDRVAIAVGPDVPEAVEVVQGVVAGFSNAGVEADLCTVVASNSEVADHFRASFGRHDSGATSPQVVVHDPDDERDQCFVGLSRKKQPLVVNRTIFEADVVLPIGRAYPYGGIFESLYPQFSSTAAIEEYRTPSNRSTQEDRKQQRRAIAEAGELIGAPLVMQVVPGPGGSVADVVAGEPHAVARRVAESFRKQWSRRSERRANLVVATVTGGDLAQTWENVGRAIAAAERLVEEDGAIAICTNLDRPLGESLSRLVGQRNASATAKHVFHEHAEDSWAAWRIARAIARGPLYLLSQLESDAVEEMGMAPVGSIDELVRLAGRRASTIVLEDAQYAIAAADGNGD
jgi:nickel-dependent lactate racemase